MYHKWTEEEKQKVIELFPNTKTKDLSKILNITCKQIDGLARKYNLYKSKEHISKMIGERNKLLARDLSIENLKEIAKQYLSYSDFYNKDNSACQTIRKLGLTDELCNHMVFGGYSSPQLILKIILKKILNISDNEISFNNRKILYPYELDIYISKHNLAFEYNGYHWHKDNIKIDNLKIEKCKELNINCIKIYEYKKGITTYIKDIKEQLMQNLNIINKQCNTNIIMHDINSVNEKDIILELSKYILNEKNIIEETQKYNSIKEFKIKNGYLYNKLKQLKLFDKYTQHMVQHRIYWNKDLCENEITKYEYLGDFVKNSWGCYQYIMKRVELKYLLKKLKRKKNNLTKL